MSLCPRFPSPSVAILVGIDGVLADRANFVYAAQATSASEGEYRSPPYALEKARIFDKKNPGGARLACRALHKHRDVGGTGICEQVSARTIWPEAKIVH